MTKMPACAPLEGLAVPSHPSGEGDGARGSNSNSSATKTFFLRKNQSPVGFKGFRSTQTEDSGPLRDYLFPTSGPEFPNSPPSTIRPSAAATQATDLVAIDGRRLRKDTLIVPESVLDRLLKATRPCTPCNPKSVLERLKLKYSLRGTVGAEKLPEQVPNSPLPGSASADFLTSVDAHPHMDGAIPPENFLDLFGNVPSARTYAAYVSIAVELASSSTSRHLPLAPAPIIHEGRDGMKPLAQSKARVTYEDRYLPTLAPSISSPDHTLEKRDAVEASSGRASTSIDTLPSMKGSTATQGNPSGPFLLTSRQAHLDSLGSLRHEAAACRPPDLSPGPTSNGFTAEGFGSRSDYDSFFFPSLPARKGTPPPANFGKATTGPPLFTRPRAHSSPPYGFDSMATKFVTVRASDLGDFDWRPPTSWETGQWQPQRPCSPSSESDLVYTGGAIYSDSPYRSVYFEYGSPSLSCEETSEEGSLCPTEDDATPKCGDLYKK